MLNVINGSLIPYAKPELGHTLFRAIHCTHQTHHFPLQFQNPNSQFLQSSDYLGCFECKMPLNSPAMTQNDSESDPRSQLTKIANPSQVFEKKTSSKRLKDVEVYVPIVYGTIAFWLGRKATETQSHRWTIYVRGATNEDLSGVIKKVVFQLHPSFNNPVRVVESPPFELSECGWGEFEIAISLHFHDDVGEKKLDLYHHLKLYTENEPGPQSTKKPVVVETYNEVVFPDPPEDFFSRIQNHPAVVVPRLPPTFKLPPAPIEDLHELKKGDTKNHPLSQWFINFSEADELLKLTAARQRVQAHIVKLRRQLSVMDELPPTVKMDSD